MSIHETTAIVLNGVATGCIYGMFGVSLNIAYRPTNIFNMAQGQLFMLGMMLTWYFSTSFGWNWFVAVGAAVSCVFLIALLEEKIAIGSFVSAGKNQHGWILTTLAFSLVAINVADRVWGSDPRGVPPIPGTSVSLGPDAFLPISSHELLTIAFAFFSVAAIELWYKRTLVGRAIVAIAENIDGARLCGIRPRRLVTLSIALSGAYAALTGVLAAPVMLASTSSGMDLLIKGFMVAAIGGIGSMKGALVGGVLIGLAQALGARMLSPSDIQIAIFVLFITVLLARPSGLFGAAQAREV